MCDGSKELLPLSVLTFSRCTQSSVEHMLCPPSLSSRCCLRMRTQPLEFACTRTAPASLSLARESSSPSPAYDVMTPFFSVRFPKQGKESQAILEPTIASQ